LFSEFFYVLGGEIMAKDQKDVGSRPKDPVEVALDMIDEDELPEYQASLQRLVTIAQQDPTLEKYARGLGPASLKLAFVVIDPRVKRTVVEFCKVADVNRSTYYEAITNPKWVAFKNELAKRFTEDSLGDAWVSLRHQIKLGNMKAIRLLFELRGDLVQRTESHNISETAEERMKRLRVKEAMKGTGVPASEDGMTEAGEEG
jgi:hypothetical protein